MEYGGEVALDYSVMKHQGNGNMMTNLSDMSRLSNTNMLTNNKSEYSAFKVVQPKGPITNNNSSSNSNNNNNTLDYG